MSLRPWAPNFSCLIDLEIHLALAIGPLAGMVYTRPSASDYDDWETVYQNPGWGSKDLIPLLRKVRRGEG